MVLWQQGLKFATRKMPKVIDPTTHAVLDYAVAGTLLLIGARLWKRNRRAAVGSLISGAATLANAMVTDYPGGVFKKIEYKAHGRYDAAIAGFTASAPRLLRFSGEAEARYLDIVALTETAVIGLTDFHCYEGDKSLAA